MEGQQRKNMNGSATHHMRTLLIVQTAFVLIK